MPNKQFFIFGLTLSESVNICNFESLSSSSFSGTGSNPLNEELLSESLGWILFNGISWTSLVFKSFLLFFSLTIIQVTGLAVRFIKT